MLVGGGKEEWRLDCSGLEVAVQAERRDGGLAVERPDRFGGFPRLEKPRGVGCLLVPPERFNYGRPGRAA